MRYRESAICLRTTDYSETSQVVHFLTRGEGVVHLMAKGSKRAKSKSGGAIDLLSEGDLVYISSGGETLGTLVEFSESVSHGPLRRQAKRLYAGLYMIELAGEMLAPADPHPEVFDLLHNGLARLAASDAPIPAVLAYFQWRLLRHVGLMGEMDRCVSCGRSMAPSAVPAAKAWFSSKVGGMLCGDCRLAATPEAGTAADKYRVDQAALEGLAALRAAQAGRKVLLADAQANAVNRLLAYHVTQQLGKTLRLARYAIE